MSTTKKRTAKQIARMHEERDAFEAYLARLRVGNRVSFDWEPEPLSRFEGRQYEKHVRKQRYIKAALHNIRKRREMYA